MTMAEQIRRTILKAAARNAVNQYCGVELTAPLPAAVQAAQADLLTTWLESPTLKPLSGLPDIAKSLEPFMEKMSTE
jgi:hypothetical protein